AAQALASLGGIGPFGGSGGGVTGKLRQAIGLDLLNFDVDPESGGGSLTVGKYVADGFFVSVTQDAQGRNGSVSVKYEVTDNIVVETELEQDGDQTVSANWKKDF
ncbi:MAG: translocation/assembly module TamB domain-containing protein, partial [Oricola sp.]|nr:translocation/assembly module TamB domain-containing protein [Oricola sp.]